MTEVARWVWGINTRSTSNEMQRANSGHSRGGSTRRTSPAYEESQQHDREVNMLKKKLSIILVLGLTLNSAVWARDCNFQEGEDRWSIKTSVPRGAFTKGVQEVDLESLIDSPNPTLSK